MLEEEFKSGCEEPESSGGCLKGDVQQTMNLKGFETSLSDDML